MRRTIEQAMLSREHNFNFIRLATSIFVIYSHAFTLTGYEKNAFFAGISVNVFFTLSGFLISASFERSKSLYQFFVSRALRIYPALIVVILVTALVIGPLFTTDSLKSYFTNIEVLKYLTNVTSLRIQHSLPGVFANNHFPDFVNGSLWTLPIVLLCYAILALTGMLVKRKVLTAIAILIPVIIFIYFHPYMIQKARYFNNVFYFLVGGLCYLVRGKIILDYRLALIMVAIFVANRLYSAGPLHLIVSAVSCTYVVMFIAFIKNDYLKKITRHGDYSYGLYIWAFPVQQILVLKFPNWNPYQNFSLAFAITLVLAMLSWHLVEKKAIALKGSLIKRRPETSLDTVVEGLEKQQLQISPERVA